ncbi:hypothetical protein MBENS4_0486 [Novosphingobium sp. MBES04]|nr:hypothetical protein MBENS4_0486 [Novosphingobium sp. MBES04]
MGQRRQARRVGKRGEVAKGPGIGGLDELVVEERGDRRIDLGITFGQDLEERLQRPPAGGIGLRRWAGSRPKRSCRAASMALALGRGVMMPSP